MMGVVMVAKATAAIPIQLARDLLPLEHEWRQRR